ncbi:peptidoglycan editing factor PgeF [Bacillota bacterium Lsc_1132]
MEPFVLQKQSFFSIEPWTVQFPGLAAGITTKNDGVSNGPYLSLNLGFHVGDEIGSVCANREKVGMQIDFPVQNWVGAEQTHGTVIRKVTKADRGKGSLSYDDSFKGTDGFYTNEQGVLLTLCYADCVPIFFIAPKKKMIGVAHAGWKGTVKQIAAHMIELWRMEGIHPKDIFAAIGPSICEKCYIVDNRVVDLVQNILEDVDEKPYNLITAGQYSLNLQKTNKLLLEKVGVPPQNILMTCYCSSCHHSQFFSHRRDRGQTGRMLSFIGWKEANSL